MRGQKGREKREKEEKRRGRKKEGKKGKGTKTGGEGRRQIGKVRWVLAMKTGDGIVDS